MPIQCQVFTFSAKVDIKNAAILAAQTQKGGDVRMTKAKEEIKKALYSQAYITNLDGTVDHIEVSGYDRMCFFINRIIGERHGQSAADCAENLSIDLTGMHFFSEPGKEGVSLRVCDDVIFVDRDAVVPAV